MPKQIVVPAEHVDAFRVEVDRELSFAAHALETRIKDGFGSIEASRARLHAAEVLYDQAHEQDGSLVIDVSESLAGTLFFIVDSEADELRGDAQAATTPASVAAMRQHVDSVVFWMGQIEALGDDLLAYAAADRARMNAELDERDTRGAR